MKKTKTVHIGSQIITYYEMTKIQKFQDFLAKILFRLAYLLEPKIEIASTKEKPKYTPKIRNKECPKCEIIKPMSDEFSYCKDCLDTMWNDYKELK